MIKIIALALTLLMTSFAAMAQTEPVANTMKSVQVECVPLKSFPLIAKRYDLRMLGQFKSKDSISVLFLSFAQNNWVMANVQKDAEQICIYQVGNGFDLNNDFIFIDPKASHPV